MPSIVGMTEQDFSWLQDERLPSPHAGRQAFARRLSLLPELPPQHTVQLADWTRQFGPRHTVQLAEDWDALDFLRSNFESFAAMSAEVIYRSPRRIDRYISVSNQYGWGDTQGFWTVFDQAADAEFLSDYMSQAPQVGVNQREIPFTIFPYGNNVVGATYTLAAIRRAAEGTRALNGRAITYGTIAGLRLREETVLMGNAIFGKDYTKGLLNQRTGTSMTNFEDENTGETLIYEKNLAKNLNGSFGGTNEYADVDAMILDFQGVFSDIVKMTHGEFANDMSERLVLIMPTTQANVLMNVRLPDTSMPAWEYLRRYNAWTRRGNPPLDIVELDYPYLDTAATGGKPRAVVTMINPEFATVEEIQAPMIGMPRQNGDAYEIPIRGAMGPYTLKQPASMIYVNLEPH